MAAAQGDSARAFDAATTAHRAPNTTLRIDLIGDSTQTDNAGYGRGFCANLTPAVDCLNMAKGGASTRTDLLSLSTAVLQKMTQAEADEFDATGHADARAENASSTIDRTHLDEKGKAVFGRIVADSLIRTR